MIVGGAVAALGGICLGPTRSGATRPGQEGPVAVTDLSKLHAGSAEQVNYGGQPLLVIRPAGDDGGAADVRAFSAICTHEGCVVGWNAEQQRIRCPCHGGVFDVMGQVVEGPPPAPLYSFEVEIRDGKVYIAGA